MAFLIWTFRFKRQERTNNEFSPYQFPNSFVFWCRFHPRGQSRAKHSWATSGKFIQDDIQSETRPCDGFLHFRLRWSGSDYRVCLFDITHCLPRSYITLKRMDCHLSHRRTWWRTFIRIRICWILRRLAISSSRSLKPWANWLIRFDTRTCVVIMGEQKSK